MAAGLNLSVGISEQQLADISRLMTGMPNKAKKVIPHALNRAAESAKTFAKRLISKDLGIPGSSLISPHRFGARKGQSVGEALRVEKASPNKLEAHLWISGRRIPVFKFKAKQSPPRDRTPKRIKDKAGNWKTVRLRPGGAKWRIGSRSAGDQQAFVATMSSGHVGVFKRVGSVDGLKRQKIIELFGPSVPHAAEGNAAFNRAVNVDVRDVLRKRIDYEIARLLESK